MTLRYQLFRASLLALLLGCLLAHAAAASVTLVDDKEVIVAAHEVIEDDLVVWAPYVRIDGLVRGDLVVLGSEVVVEGIIEQDLLVVSKTLYLNGSVNDDLRAVSYAIALGDEARVADDFWSVGYSLETKPGSRIGGSVGTATRQVLLAGQVAEGVLARAGALEIQGLIAGSVNAVVGGLEGYTHSSLVVDVNVEIPEVADGITIAESAAIGGDLDHRSQDPARVAQGAHIAGAVRHEPWQGASASGPGSATSFDGDFFEESPYEGVERLAVLLLVGFLLAVAAPRFLAERVDRIRDEPVNLAGWGLGSFIFWLIVAAITGIAFFILLVLGLTTGLGGLAVTAIFAGALLQSALAALFLLAAIYVAPALAAAGMGRAILDRIRPSVEAAEPSLSSGLSIVVIGGALYAALRLVPVLGTFVGLAAALVGLGTMAVWLRDRFAAD